MIGRKEWGLCPHRSFDSSFGRWLKPTVSWTPRRMSQIQKNGVALVSSPVTTHRHRFIVINLTCCPGSELLQRKLAQITAYHRSSWRGHVCSAGLQSQRCRTSQPRRRRAAVSVAAA